MVTPSPPEPFNPHTVTLPAGSQLVRVFNNAPGRTAAIFNPGLGPGGRFSFFGSPPVPVLYAAQTQEAAICETLLHDVPVTGGVLFPEDYENKVAARLSTTRDLRLASFLGTGLRALRIEAAQLADTTASEYPRTVGWAEAAHRCGLDGVAWMSKRCNSDRAYVLFGDRLTSTDLEIDPTYGRIFATGADLDWLIDFCAGLHVDVLAPRV
ncbi:RES family NAD+ phosphorylase [Tomitella biformata]|uniref:RES family NAD+ phosphorylase n=1 Tax=Tomitella biformata TaxID=630403 RepID=UPI000464C94D|nr:RES family NAD+ phosphorylase [Tomitella biformata]